MSLMLASVNSLAEAQFIHQFAVDIIDLKQPAAGALGALDCDTVQQIVNALPDAHFSATIGDLPMQAELLKSAVTQMAATGVNYVKIGFFPGGEWDNCIASLSEIALNTQNLIAVLFADSNPEFAYINKLANAGFKGVMLDTMQKQQGNLSKIYTLETLSEFVTLAKQHKLFTGLAGSLKMEDIPALLPLKADYLGFRGALCENQLRTAKLDGEQIQNIRAMLVRH